MDTELNLALSYVKSGNITLAYGAMAIEPSLINERNFIGYMQSYETAKNLINKGNFIDAAPYLEEILPLCERSGIENVRVFSSILNNFTQGVSLLLQGNAHNALLYLNNCEKQVSDINFFNPSFNKILLSVKAAVQLAIAKTRYYSGNIKDTEIHFGKAIAYYNELEHLLDVNDPSDLPLLNEAYATKVELCIFLVKLELETLSYDEAISKINQNKKSNIKLKSIMHNIPESEIKNITVVISILFDVLECISNLGKSIITNKNILNKKDYLKIQRSLE